jgi:chromosome segregation protein
MRVKRLEIHGFKSFKDKTVIHFDDGVTGIVGPNGCGKSNIVDAFFWVMGEQSNKHMRASESLDLIFNGSEKYTPLSMAEVTMVLATGASKDEMPDGASVRDLPAHLKYEEISVTRRLYRDATSEYLINGQTCRLKDIHELFMDTGAGPKAYSIIEQGQISKIVASKPEDRRTLIEEAAGIVKFKARKKESLRKIEATQQNLLRINDIIAEIERQLSFLERQASKARQYKKYKDELFGKEVLVSRKKLFGIKVKGAEIATRLQELEIDEVETRSQLQAAELRIENLKIQMTEAQRLAEDAQSALQNLQREFSQDDTKMQLTRNKIEDLENSSFTLEDELTELTGAIEGMSAEKTQIEQEAEELKKLFENTDSILKEQQLKLDEAKTRSEEMGRVLEQDKRDLMSALTRRSDISNQVHAYEGKVDTLSIQINTLGARIKDRTMDHEILSEKHGVAKEAFDRLTGEVGESSARMEVLKSYL